MPSTWRVMTMGNHALNLLRGETTPIDAILAQLIKKWLLPKVHPDIMKELFLLMGAEVMRWNPRGQIVCNVGEPRGLLCRDSKEMLVKKSIVEGDILALDNKPGKIISDDILDSCLVLDLPIKLRQE